ncbi:MAG: proton-conducting membrane transporter [Lachnospiraceae bacterium]|nr:proton-conducting membrane transporter [Lachnospiraceae bacterium]MCI7190904.1 proton-conducting membrane transporter [Lachnospiraceae bacterium]MDD7627234.1 proton-conducting transporter membrane subunit [Lachnospiraceae bacterium]MDY4119117.1 proton-conducting transporter membrane subunit [Lachnospiraceae bacterium]
MYLLFNLTENLPILFKVDAMSIIFAAVTIIIFLGSGIFSLEYMKHEQKKKRFYVFYLLAFLVLMGLCFAGNLITFYLFFEMLTLASTPLVLHSGSREANMAGLKYLFYSLCGAYMALFGLYFVSKYGNTLTFSEGGVINQELAAGHTGLLLVAAFVMILGFSVKAGMFPMHAWLSAAHPVAPAPASAVLSAVIVKAGVLGIIRVIYYIFGAAFLKGTWVQTAFMVLTLITIFMGSMLAYREPVLKKRLAYSTVSQVSYILFGLSAMDMNSVTGGVLHVIAHGFIKAALFLCAGAIIYMTGKTRVEELKGIGKEMPLLMWCYTIVSLGLIGIPPTGGFISKWYLAMGSLETGIPGFSWIGPVVLLVSALLTAGYLLPITIQGFFPGADYDYKALKKKEPSALMTVPVLILTVLTVFMGLFPGQLISWIQQAVTKLI